MLDETLSRERRVGLSSHTAHKANDLHPVLRYYQLPLEGDWKESFQFEGKSSQGIQEVLNDVFKDSGKKREENQETGETREVEPNKYDHPDSKFSTKDNNPVDPKHKLVGETPVPLHLYRPYAEQYQHAVNSSFVHGGFHFLQSYTLGADTLSCTMNGCFVRASKESAVKTPQHILTEFQTTLKKVMKEEKKVDGEISEEILETTPLVERLEVEGEGSYTLQVLEELNLGLELRDSLYYNPLPIYPRPVSLTHLVESVVELYDDAASLEKPFYWFLERINRA